ncbi:hypothetical protein [Xanthomonas hortorum]|uniref:hypothetical protein n=1 Tax=Xanthomonas hortorum TaxID=56454 RepID=UPI001594D2F8|nr:hypothetical protein [Xanthomonas hortorum]NHF67478.1 hypothetical protein [Xanthomonas hortorum]
MGFLAALSAFSSDALPSEQANQITAFGKARLEGLHTSQARVLSQLLFGNIWIVSAQTDLSRDLRESVEVRLHVDTLPEIAQGMQLWRYTPWAAWTRRLAVYRASELKSDDVQLIYWRDHDDVYGVAVPLSDAHTSIPVQLPRFGVQLQSLHVQIAGFAALGRSDKLNGAAAIRTQRHSVGTVHVELAELCPFFAYTAKRPTAMRALGFAIDFA